MINPNNESFEQVSVFDKPAIFTSDRIDRKELPQGVYAYDVRHEDDNGFNAAELKEYILVNHMGTIITKEPIKMDENGSIMIEDENDFNFLDGYPVTLEQFIKNEFPIKEEQIDVVVVKPLRQPYHTKINNNLTAFQQQVRGYIELVSPFSESGVAIICNEEGKILGLPLNREINNDIIAGTFVITGVNDQGEFISLSDEQIEKYKQRFNDVEIYEHSSDENRTNKDDIER